MPPRSRVIPGQHEDSSSEDIDDISEEIIQPNSSSRSSLPCPTPWVDKYAPTRSRDVCINPTKMGQVKKSISHILEPGTKCRILILSGPAGSSKSTAIKCLAKELGAPSVQGSGIRPLSLIEYFDSAVDDVHQPDHFRDFMDGCRYRSGQNSSVVLIEELPNVFHDKTLQSFRDCLRDWAYSRADLDLPPVVICLTEVDLPNERRDRGYFTIDNYLTVETLLGTEFLNAGLSAGLIERVKFQPIAKKFIKQTLDNILRCEKVRLPKAGSAGAFLSLMYESGDIRSSISNLQFWASTGYPSIGFLKEGQISLFHALGKVIHSSSKPRAKGDDADCAHWAAGDVTDQYTNSGLLQLGVLENYHVYNGSHFDVKNAASIVDGLSLTDSLNSLGYEEYALQVTRHELSKICVTAATLPKKFPRHFKCLRERNKVLREVASYRTYIAQDSVNFNDINLIDGYLVPMIKNSFKYRLKHGKKSHLYNRVGGRFKQIYADDEFPSMDREQDAARGEIDQFSMDISEKISENTASKNDSDDSLSEDIENSDSNDSDDVFDDTLSDEILRVGTQASSKRSRDDSPSSNPREDHAPDLNYGDGFPDDPELYMLVSQGRL